MFFRSRKQGKKRDARRALVVEPIEARRMLAVVTVNTDHDTVDPSDHLTSLREAIEIANDLEGADEIVFDLGNSEPATIRLEHGELELTDAVTIAGPRSDLLTIDAQHESRIFNITAGRGDFVIIDLTLTNGHVSETGQNWYGGAIRSTTRGMLEIGNVIVSNNFAADRWSVLKSNAAIYSLGSVRIDSSVISENESAGVYAEGPVAVHASEISKNQGSGIIAKDATITSSTISDNKGTGVSVSHNSIAFHKAGDKERTVSLQNSTISGNQDGGIMAGSVTVSASSIIGNSKKSGIAVGAGARWDFGGGIDASDEILVTNSIVAANVLTVYCDWCGNGVNDTRSTSSASDLTSWFGSVTVRHSLIGHNHGTQLNEAPLGNPDSNGNLIGGPESEVIDARLAPLRDNGGPTLTHALLPDSPAINMGDPSAVSGADGVLPFDQRGEPYARVMEGRIDMGAFESRPVGDSNGDGVFDSADLVMVFQAGKYEDDLANNAAFDEGDWNGDGDFDTSDLVLAFQVGNYLSAAAPLAAVVDQLFLNDRDQRLAGRAVQPWFQNPLMKQSAMREVLYLGLRL